MRSILNSRGYRVYQVISTPAFLLRANPPRLGRTYVIEVFCRAWHGDGWLTRSAKRGNSLGGRRRTSTRVSGRRRRVCVLKTNGFSRIARLFQRLVRPEVSLVCERDIFCAQIPQGIITSHPSSRVSIIRQHKLCFDRHPGEREQRAAVAPRGILCGGQLEWSDRYLREEGRKREAVCVKGSQPLVW